MSYQDQLHYYMNGLQYKVKKYLSLNLKSTLTQCLNACINYENTKKPKFSSEKKKWKNSYHPYKKQYKKKDNTEKWEKKSVTCYYCKKQGHIKPVCRKYLEKQENQSGNDKKKDKKYQKN